MSFNICLFSDTSLTSVCTVVYAVVIQQNVFTQNLIPSKSRLAKKDPSTPYIDIVVSYVSETCRKCLNLF